MSDSSRGNARTYLQLPLRQCLFFSVVQLKGKHCRNGVVDTFGLCTLYTDNQIHEILKFNFRFFFQFAKP